MSPDGNTHTGVLHKKQTVIGTAFVNSWIFHMVIYPNSALLKVNITPISAYRNINSTFIGCFQMQKHYISSLKLQNATWYSDHILEVYFKVGNRKTCALTRNLSLVYLSIYLRDKTPDWTPQKHFNMYLMVCMFSASVTVLIHFTEAGRSLGIVVLLCTWVLRSSIRGTCTQPCPAGSEPLTLRGICRSATAVTLNIQWGNKTFEAVASATSKHTQWGCCRAFWSQSRWPGSRGRSRTSTFGWRRPPRCVQLHPLLLWGYWCAVPAILCGGQYDEDGGLARRSAACRLYPLGYEQLDSCSTL